MYEIEHEPDEERAELRAIYRDKGLSGPLLDRVVGHLTADRERWHRAMVHDELGVVADTRINPWLEGVQIGISFVVGGLIPTLPVLFALPQARWWAYGLTALTALILRAIKARYTGQGPVRAGLELLVVVTLGTLAYTGRFFMKPPPKPDDLTLTKLSGACGAVTSQRILLESDKMSWAGLLAKGFPVFTAELQSAAFTLGNRVFTPHRLPHAHRSEKRRDSMQSPSNHLRALVKRIVTCGMLSVVLFTAAVATGLAGSTAAQASTQTYSITDLGTLGGFSTSAYGINGNGQIAGKSLVKLKSGKTTYYYAYHAFLYSAGTMTDLGTLGGDDSEAQAVNSTADVAGFSNLCAKCYPYDAFLYHNGHMTNLGTLGGGSSHAYGINNFSEVVGDSYTASNADHAFLYSSGKMTDLGTLGGPPSGANGINDSHQVVGSSELANGSGMHAFLWSNGTMTDLGTLGGAQSIAYAINSAGQVVGYASPPTGAVHAFLYSGGKMTDLGVFYDSSVAEAINTSGVVVGSADVLNSNGTTAYHAFIYSGGQLQDLNNLIPSGSGWVLTEATGINDTGQIVCNGYNATTGYTHAFLLKPN